jgi:hypothetical protein
MSKTLVPEGIRLGRLRKLQQYVDAKWSELEVASTEERVAEIAAALRQAAIQSGDVRDLDGPDRSFEEWEHANRL